MHVKNNAARLITINYRANGKIESARVLPGDHPAVELPKAAQDLDFLKFMLESGELIEVPGPKVEAGAKKAGKTTEEE